jgi:hypothetical protein
LPKLTKPKGAEQVPMKEGQKRGQGPNMVAATPTQNKKNNKTNIPFNQYSDNNINNKPVTFCNL